MLPKINRLPLRFERNRLQELGVSYSASTLTAIIAPKGKIGPTRFALILSKKISPKAVTRNKFRRLVFNTLQPLLHQIKPGFDILLLAKKPLLDASPNQVHTDLNLLLTKSNLMSSQ